MRFKSTLFNCKPLTYRFKHLYRRLKRNSSFNIKYQKFGLYHTEKIFIMNRDNRNLCYIDVTHFYHIEKLVERLDLDMYSIMCSLINYLYDPLFTTRRGDHNNAFLISTNKVINLIMKDIHTYSTN